MAAISVKDLSLDFGSVKVLEKLTLDIESGEFIVLLGPSGCGKSTLLNCIAGLLDATTGQIFISGKNVTWMEPKDRGIGMVFQSYALYPQMTVRGNLSFGLKNAGLPNAEIAKRVKRVSGLLQIGELLERKPAALSGGQRQRVAIGRALVRDVDVFLFDEPLSNLDAKLRAELRVEIKRLHQQLENNTMVYVTHDQIEALTLADRIAVMRAGKIQQLDEPHVIYNRPRNLYVAGFIGSPSMNFLKGSIESTESDVHKFVLGECTFACSGYEASGQLAAGQAILGLRPEHVLIGESANVADTVRIGEATVELWEPMGSDSLVWLQIGGQSCSARVESSMKLERGQKVAVATDLRVASIFDASSEERI